MWRLLFISGSRKHVSLSKTFSAEAKASWPDAWVSPPPPVNSNLSNALINFFVEVKGPWILAAGSGKQSDAWKGISVKVELFSR